MSRRIIVAGSVVGVLLLAGAGAGIAAALGAFSSGNTPVAAAATTTPYAGGGFGDAPAGDGLGGYGGGGGFRGRGGGIFGSLNAAATYLGVSAQDLFGDLRDGTTLESIAQSKGKSVSGLIDAMVTAEKQSLEQAVSSGQLTQAQEQQLESAAKARITSLVQNGFGGFGGGRPGNGFGGGGGNNGGGSLGSGPGTPA